MTTAVLTRAVATEVTRDALILNGKFHGIRRWADLDLDTIQWKCEQPEWFASAVEELRWARDCGENSAAIMLDDEALLIHPYTLTIRDRLEEANATWKYDPFTPAFRISKPVRHADLLRELCDLYEIPASSRFENHLAGLDEAVTMTAASAAQAIERGFRLPTGFAGNRKLKPHQEEGVLALAASGGGLLADQVGLGKGGQFVCGLLSLNDWLEREKGTAPNYPAIVAVTKSMRLEIATEITRWKPDATIEIITTAKAGSIDPDTEFVVINHDLLSARKADLLAIKPKAFIADEAHVYKNLDTARTRAALDIAKAVRANAPKHPYIVLATGTPFLNAPRELWALLMILGWDWEVFALAKRLYREKHGTTLTRTRLREPKNAFANKARGQGKITFGERELWPQRAFEIRWCGGTYDRFGAWHASHATNTAELNRLLLDLGMIRRRKSDVMNPLPPLTESIHPITLDDTAMQDYNRMSDEFRDWLIETVRAEALKTGTSAKRAVASALRRLDAGEAVMRMTKLREALSAHKVPHTVSWVHRFMAGEYSQPGQGRDKLILFVHHQRAMDMLLTEPTFRQYNPVSILSTSSGKQKDQEIADNKHAFQTDPNVRLILCSMAAREGHTLTAAKDVYLHEMPFVPSWIVQMAGRCWARLSEEFEPHEAYLHYAIALGTIDSMLVKMNAVKKAMFNAVIDGEGSTEDADDLLWARPDIKSGETWREARERSGERLLEAFRIGERDLEIAR